MVSSSAVVLAVLALVSASAAQSILFTAPAVHNATFFAESWMLLTWTRSTTTTPPASISIHASAKGSFTITQTLVTAIASTALQFNWTIPSTLTGQFWFVATPFNQGSIIGHAPPRLVSYSDRWVNIVRATCANHDQCAGDKYCDIKNTCWVCGDCDALDSVDGRCPVKCGGTNATTAMPLTNATTAVPITNATTNATTTMPLTNGTTAMPLTNATTEAVNTTTTTPTIIANTNIAANTTAGTTVVSNSTTPTTTSAANTTIPTTTRAANTATPTTTRAASGGLSALLVVGAAAAGGGAVLIGAIFGIVCLIRRRRASKTRLTTPSSDHAGNPTGLRKEPMHVESATLPEYEYPDPNLFEMTEVRQDASDSTGSASGIGTSADTYSGLSLDHKKYVKTSDLLLPGQIFAAAAASTAYEEPMPSRRWQQQPASAPHIYIDLCDDQTA